ncbi:MAG: hypothetical protein ACYTF2_13940 [Planctomycetota bacterium]|jgi:hypothetical protein
MLIRSKWVMAGLGPILAGSAHCDVIEFTERDEWIGSVGAFVTADFTGFPDFTVITDQYVDLGVTFTDGNDMVFLSQPAFPNDGAGLDGNGDVSLSFNAPQAWIGVDYPGLLRIELYSAGQLIFTSNDYNGGVGNFLGLVSSDPFDAAVLIDPLGLETEIDDLHFGVPAPGSFVILGLGLLMPRRGRKWSAS